MKKKKEKEKCIFTFVGFINVLLGPCFSNQENEQSSETPKVTYLMKLGQGESVGGKSRHHPIASVFSIGGSYSLVPQQSPFRVPSRTLKICVLIGEGVHSG